MVKVAGFFFFNLNKPRKPVKYEINVSSLNWLRLRSRMLYGIDIMALCKNYFLEFIREKLIVERLHYLKSVPYHL